MTMLACEKNTPDISQSLINEEKKRNSQAGSAHCLPASHSLHSAAFVSLKYPGGQIVGPSVIEGHLLPGRQMVHLI